MPGVTVLIPARLSSRRLAGKVLADIAGLPMVVHVMRRAALAERVERVCREFSVLTAFIFQARAYSPVHVRVPARAAGPG